VIPRKLELTLMENDISAYFLYVKTVVLKKTKLNVSYVMDILLIFMNAIYVRKMFVINVTMKIVYQKTMKDINAITVMWINKKILDNAIVYWLLPH